MPRFAIIDSTLREGEQFANAFFSTEQKIRIATLLDAFGVEYIELTSPAASPRSQDDCATIARLGLRAKTLTHTRCHPKDVEMALATGVDGVDVVIGTSSELRRFSHGKSIDEIIAIARDVIPVALAGNVEVRFSTEDSLRSDLSDILRVYEAVSELGVHRVGIADTIGIGSPTRIAEIVSAVRAVVGPKIDIEFHGHNDTGCAVANAWAAVHAGATHVDTTVLGIGERNGITPLAAFVARMYVDDAEGVKRKYRLPLLRDLDHTVAKIVGVDVPFNACVTGFCAFTHKAGIHAKAVLNNPSTYEVLAPDDFGLSRYINVASRLTGWNAIQHRAAQLGLTFTDAQARHIAEEIKTAADAGHMTLDHVDAILHAEFRRVSEPQEALPAGLSEPKPAPALNGHAAPERILA
ncbi:MAG TPA: homocitrate synthase [Phycisphaerales bacterium]|nr:homocitrate synthase [Phycisphaerales bacterium]